VVVAHFETAPDFPDRMPSITLQTLISVRNGQCFKTVYCSYPYSPRWPPAELAERNRSLCRC